MKIILTGGAGFIGSELSEYILKNLKNSKIKIIDNLSRGYLQRIKDIKKKVIFIKADVKKISNLKLNKSDWIIHASAIAPLPDNQISHRSSLEENLSQCGAIVDFCLQTGTKNILFLSSSAVYEKTKSKIFSETKVTQPILMYPLSKYLAEKYFESVCKSYDLNVVSLRLANIFGRKQDYFRKQIPFLGYLIKNSLLKKNLTLFAKGDFKRDYLFIDDLNRLILLILTNTKFKKKNKIYEVLNVGSGYKYSVPNFVNLIQKILNQKINVLWGKKTDYWKKYDFLYKSKIKFDQKLIEKEVKKIVALNLKKVKKMYNWKAEYKINEALEECILAAKKVLKIK
jgi:nucleoside-diphosphate-sugar epimerase